MPCAGNMEPQASCPQGINAESSCLPETRFSSLDGDEGSGWGKGQRRHIEGKTWKSWDCPEKCVHLMLETRASPINAFYIISDFLPLWPIKIDIFFKI